jgi:phage gp46-like protein
MNDQRLVEDGYDLQSAVIVALGTNSLAPPDADLPDLDSNDRQGWWGDMDADVIWNGWPVGCLLWLLRRASITGPGARGGATVARAESYTRNAMKPFVDNLIATRIDAGAVRTDTQRIDVSVVIYRGPNPAVAMRYADLWDELGR